MVLAAPASQAGTTSGVVSRGGAEGPLTRDSTPQLAAKAMTRPQPDDYPVSTSWIQVGHARLSGWLPGQVPTLQGWEHAAGWLPERLLTRTSRTAGIGGWTHLITGQFDTLSR